MNYHYLVESEEFGTSVIFSKQYLRLKHAEAEYRSRIITGCKSVMLIEVGPSSKRVLERFESTDARMGRAVTALEQM